jgi:HrpA-like RNA helicase
MFDILELTERFETVNKQRGQTAVYETVPVHSDVPFDDQLRALEPAQGKNAIKIVIATNAAESSLTIPDCDHVICMGQAKSIEYNPTTHRTILLPAWIAKSSAIQRAGRTGRTRPGQGLYVFRACDARGASGYRLFKS